MEDEGPGGRDVGIPPFKTPTLNKETLQAEDSMRDGYHPKMLLYVLDKLFYVYMQVKNSRRLDEKLVLAYEILCISTNCCTDRRNGIEKTGVPDALALLNVEDIRHLECLAWAVYDDVLMVGLWPELLGNCPWCTVLAGLQQHIYRGHEDAAHCSPQTLSSWDHQEWVEALCCVGGLSSVQSRQRGASQPRRRSQSGSHCCSQMPARDGHSCAMSPHMPSRCPHGATLLPCATLRCYCGSAASHNVCTTPKVALAVNVSIHTRSSRSGEGMAQASLDQDEAQEDDFQTQHTPVCHMMWQEDDNRRSSAEGRLQHSRGSPGQWTGYQIDIGKEEEMLETVDPTWRATHWLQLVVQGISDDEVPWYDLVTPLTVGTEGAALSLAKRSRVQGQDVCPPAPTVLNIGQFMTWEEVQGTVDNSLWFEVYSHALQRVGEAVRSRRWQWPKGKAWEVGVSPLVRVFWEETSVELTTSCTRLCWELLPRCVQEEGEGCYLAHNHLPR